MEIHLRIYKETDTILPRNFSSSLFTPCRVIMAHRLLMRILHRALQGYYYQNSFVDPRTTKTASKLTERISDYPTRRNKILLRVLGAVKIDVGKIFKVSFELYKSRCHTESLRFIARK